MLNIRLRNNENEKMIAADVEEMQDSNIRVTVPARSIGEGWEYADILYDYFKADKNDTGYYVIPDIAGARLVKFKNDGKEVNYDSDRLSLRLIGCIKNGLCTAGKVTGMSDEYRLVCGKTDGEYYYFLRFPLEGRKPYEDIEIILHRFIEKDADYGSMACWYREYGLKTGELTSLADKAKSRPAVRYAAESINIRIRMAWKPAPSKIPEQTRENEPPVRIACTFKMVGDLIDELKVQGVEKADICLVGWNIRGHDGRWPEMFPVEPGLGGEEQLKILIGKAAEAGYTLNLHTNCTDAYSIAEDFSSDYIIKKSDGSLAKNFPWSGGTMYDVALPLRKEIFTENIKKVKKLGVTGPHYCDVISAVLPRRSYDKKFPMTPEDYRSAADEILMNMRDIFGAASSEGGIDHYIKYLDYVLYGEMGDWKSEYNDWMDEKIPLWAMVYHGILLYNSSNQTINYAIKDFTKRLRNIEYGARPAAYCFVDFLEGIPFWGKEDLTWKEGEKPVIAAKTIAGMYSEYKDLTGLQYSHIVRHEILSDKVKRVTYDNGIIITIDYENGSYEITGS